ncbi:conserved hypothetical protein [Histoplasma capsulatum var. duboisii H88]|uniref:Uncharacterized protein n=1 Tax=Ajellomyces capsulatus (strain H88) TaxID=544711 RepID=F0UTA9_AJEC8|nr:conserved hypothetical protein [Histoplasma capsulatum var. duboisii H88]
MTFPRTRLNDSDDGGIAIDWRSERWWWKRACCSRKWRELSIGDNGEKQYRLLTSQSTIEAGGLRVASTAERRGIGRGIGGEIGGGSKMYEEESKTSGRDFGEEGGGRWREVGRYVAR